MSDRVEFVNHLRALSRIYHKTLHERDDALAREQGVLEVLSTHQCPTHPQEGTQPLSEVVSQELEARHEMVREELARRGLPTSLNVSDPEPGSRVETDYAFEYLVEALRANADARKEPGDGDRRRAADAIERLARSILALRQALAAREVDQ